jgi:hypothetical protein
MAPYRDLNLPRLEDAAGIFIFHWFTRFGSGIVEMFLLRFDKTANNIYYFKQ